jgi:hypothetical protein
MTQDFTSQMSLVQQQIRATNSALAPAVTELLKSDDRILLKLEKLMADLAGFERADGNITMKSETFSRKYGWTIHPTGEHSWLC